MIHKADCTTAKSIGVDLRMLVRGVFQIEIQLENWSLADMRRQLTEVREPFSSEKLMDFE